MRSFSMTCALMSVLVFGVLMRATVPFLISEKDEKFAMSERPTGAGTGLVVDYGVDSEAEKGASACWGVVNAGEDHAATIYQLADAKVMACMTMLKGHSVDASRLRSIISLSFTLLYGPFLSSKRQTLFQGAVFVLFALGFQVFPSPLARAATLTAFPPVQRGASLATLSGLTALPDPNSLPNDERVRTLDPWAVDPDRYGLPIGLSGSSSFAGWVNASVGGVACKGVRAVSGWEPDGSGSVGMVCEGLPEGESGKVVGVEVWAETADGELFLNSGPSLVRYDDLRDPIVAEVVSKVASGSNGGPDLTDGDNFGRSVCWVGGDDEGALLVGANGDDTGFPDAGSVYLMRVDEEGVASDARKIASGVNGGPTLGSSNLFGTSVAWLGDVNEDGEAWEVAVGAPETTGSNTGSVYVMNVRFGEASSILARITDNMGGGPDLDVDDYFGNSLASLGDLDGDGRAFDIAVGAHGDDTGGTNRGTVYVMSILSNGDAKLLTKITHGDGSSGPVLKNVDNFGFSTSSLWGWKGWEEEDGRMLAACSELDDTGANGAGAVYVIHVSSVGSVTVKGKVASGTGGGPPLATYDEFGVGLSSMGDLDGDGSTIEVLAGTWGDDTGGSSRGAVYVISLRVSTWDVKWWRKIASETGGGPLIGNSDNFGICTTFVGDLSGFGRPNSIIVGAHRNDESGTDRGAIYILTLADLTDLSSPPAIQGASFPTLSHSFMMPLFHTKSPPQALAQLDPHASDPSRTTLSLSLLTSTFNASHSLTILNASIDSRPCTSTQLIPDWPVSSNSRRMGVACVGVPEGESGKVVGVEVWVEEVGSGRRYSITGSSVARYDDLSIPLVTSFTEYGVEEVSSVGSNSFFGAAVAPLGSLTGDSEVTVVAVGAIQDATGGTNRGSLFLISLDASGDMVETIGKIASDTNGGPTLSDQDRFGCSVGHIGDLNGDGSAFDILVGSLGDDTGGSDRGAVFVLSLSSDGQATVLSKLASGQSGLPSLSDGGQFGFSIAIPGDLNGDGIFNEVLVGAYRDSEFGSLRGKVYVLQLDASGSASVLQVISDETGGGPSLQDGARFGGFIASLGNWRRDQLWDVAVSSSTTVYFASIGTDGKASIFAESDSAIGSAMCSLGHFLGIGSSIQLAVGGSNVVKILSLEQGGFVSVLYEISSASSGAPVLTNGGQFGSSLAIFQVHHDATLHILVGAKKEGSGGSLFQLALSDVVDVSGTPLIVGSAEPTSSVQAIDPLASSYLSLSRLPSLDPHAIDPTRRILPLSILTSTFNATFNLRLLNASIDSRPCDSVQLIEGWPVSSNPRRIGVACVGAPEGESGKVVGAEVWVEEAGSGAIYPIMKYSIARYSTSSIQTRTPAIASSHNGGPDLADNDRFGNSVQHIGDVNGDGIAADLAIGAYLSDVDSGSDRGAVYLISMASDATTVLSTTELSSGMSGMPSFSGSIYFGHDIAWIGDVDLDGLASDIAVGAPLQDTTDTNQGAVYILSLSRGPGVRHAVPIAHETNGGPSLPANEWFGVAVAAIGDVDGDGLASDIAVGSYADPSSNDDDRGAVYILSLLVDGTAHSVTRIAWDTTGPSIANMEYFGGAIACIGDVDGDGIAADLVVGAHKRDTGGTERGSIFAIPLTPSGEAKWSTEVAHGINGGPSLSDYSQFGLEVFFLGEDVQGTTVAPRVAVLDNKETIFIMQVLADGSAVNLVSLRDSSGSTWTSITPYRYIPTSASVEFVVGDSSDDTGGPNRGAILFRQLDEFDGSLRVRDKLLVVMNKTGAAFGLCGVTACTAEYNRGGIIVGGSIDLIATLNPRSAGLEPLVASIGGYTCGSVDHISSPSLHTATFRCNSLVLPQSMIAALPVGESGTSVRLIGASLRYRTTSESSWVFDGASTLSLPVGTERIVETNASVVALFVPLSQLAQPNGSFVDAPVTISPLATVEIAVEFENFPIADGATPRIAVSRGTAEITSSSRSTGLGSVLELSSLTLSLQLCSAGTHTGNITISTFSGNLMVVLPSLELAKPQVSTVVSESLDISGGSVMMIHGAHFGAMNLSAATDPSSNASLLCGNVWNSEGFLRSNPSPADDPRTVVFGAFVGGRPCLSTAWLNSTAIRCIAPAGFGTNLPVSVSIEGHIATLESAVSYAALPHVSAVSPASDHDTTGSTLTLTSSAVALSSLPGISASGSRIGLWGATSGSISISLGSSTASNVPVPAGVGGNHKVSLCFKNDPASVHTSAQVLNVGSLTACTATSSAATLNYTIPSIIGVEPSVDLDPLGGDRLVLTGTDFGAPDVVLSGDVDISVEVAGNLCADVAHPSSTEIRCTTTPMAGSSTAAVRVTIGGLASNTIEVSVLRVSLLAVVPRYVLPAAPSRLSYDFSVSVFAAEEVTAVIIGGQRCDSPSFEGEELLLCKDVPAPSVWPTDDSWLEITGNNNSVSRRPVLRAEPPPSILAVDTSVAGAPTLGGTLASVVGEGFGLESTDFAGVLVGGDEGDEGVDVFASPSTSIFLTNTSSNTTWISSSTIRIIVPRGLGQAVPVRVVTTWGLVSPPVFFSYDLPTPTSFSPSILIPGVDAQEVTICGTSFPPAEAWVDEIVVGGVSCPGNSLLVVSDACVRCTALPTPGSLSSPLQDGWDENEAVVVTVGERTSAFARGLATFVPLPRLTGSTVSTVSPGDVVGLDGEGMGEVDGYVEAVFVGGSEEDVEGVRNGSVDLSKVASAVDVVRVDVDWVSGVRVRFEMPDGVGVGVGVRFTTTTGLISNPTLISYNPPTITSITPSVLLPGWSALNITLRGSNFPTRIEDATHVSIGGVECETLELIASTALKCLNQPTPNDGWTSEVIIVESGGQASDASAAGSTFVEPPVITSVVPSTAGPGDVIQMVGRGFGESVSDVDDVIVGGVSCFDTLSFESSTALRCTIPSPHPIWTNASDGIEVVPFVFVEIKLISGIAADPDASDASPILIPAGLRHRPNPHILPAGIASWRPVAQSGTVFVRWRFPGSSLENFLNSRAEGIAAAAPVESFTLHISPYSDFSGSAEEDVIVSRGRSAPERIAESTALDESDPDAWEWFDSRVPVFERAPLFVRIRTENGDGEGEWVKMVYEGVLRQVGARVPETCSESQFVTTHESSVDEIMCRDCPVGATCAGLTSDNVTAQDGYWRVPWSPYKLGFARCFIPTACIGTASSSTQLRTIDTTIETSPNDTAVQVWAASDANDHPATINGVQLTPSVERCATGHRGVLCGSCETNYFPGIGRICTGCGDRAWIAGRFLLLVMAILFVFSLLLLRAWKTRADKASKEVQIAKIFFSHLQSVAIVGAVQLRWPAGAAGFFAVVDAGSSFTTSGLALECLLGEASSSPFARTAAVLSMPLVLVLFAAVFWTVVQFCEAGSGCCGRFMRTEDADDQKDGEGRGEEEREGERGRGRGGEGGLEARIPDPDPDPTPSPSPSSRSKKAMLTDRSESMMTMLRRRLLVSIIVIAFLVHTPLTSAAFRLLTCQPIAPDDDPSASQLRLAMDLDINCEDPSNLAAMLGMGIPMLVLIGFGIPIGATLFLRSIGSERLQTTTWRELLGFLFNGYRIKLYFWESIVLMRKVMLAFVTTVLAPSGPTMQLLTAIVVILIAQIIHSRSRPYNSNVINALESFGMVAAALTLIGGVFVVADSNGLTGTAQAYVGTVASVLIVTINVLFFLAVVILISKRGRTAATAWYRRFVDSLGIFVETEDEAQPGERRRPRPSMLQVARAVSRRQLAIRTPPPASTTSAPKPVKEGSAFAYENPLQQKRE